jgi:diadenosine tetraphosphate (Ap4A) HIT family hydrolase
MPQAVPLPTIIFQDDSICLEASAECAVPGYLILRLRRPVTTWGELAPETAARLGAMLARAAAAVEAATGADRVYVQSFCEVDRRLHFHIFPRTRWLADVWRRAHPGAGGPVDGPRLFVWAREAFPTGAPLPAGTPDPAAILDSLRTFLTGGWISPGEET